MRSKTRRIARGEADAELAKNLAEAKGPQSVLEAKAEGYRQLLEACATRPDIAPTLLLIEKLPALVAEQVKAISNLKIDLPEALGRLDEAHKDGHLTLVKGEDPSEASSGHDDHA